MPLLGCYGWGLYQFEDDVEFRFEILKYTVAAPGWKPSSPSSGVDSWDDRLFLEYSGWEFYKLNIMDEKLVLVKKETWYQIAWMGATNFKKSK